MERPAPGLDAKEVLAAAQRCAWALTHPGDFLVPDASEEILARLSAPYARTSGTAMCSAWRCSSTDAARAPAVPVGAVGQESDPIALHIEPEHGMPVVALRIHQRRLAQPPPDRP